MNNLIYLSDSYKVSHYKGYPPNTKNIYSYLEARGGGDYTIWAGLQGWVRKHLVGEVLKKEHIDECAEDFKAHFFGDSSLFNEKGWRRLLEKHKGYLPISIRALPEGSRVPISTPLMTIENTDEEFPWLTNYLETLACQLWYPTTVATISHWCKSTIQKFLDLSGDDAPDYKLHDFGCRGGTCMEAVAIGGAAHLLNFSGTDTLPALRYLKQYYNTGIVGNSIPAAEHSTITSWGRENEVQAFRNMLEQFPTGFVAVVSDSYDIKHAVSQLWGEELKPLVEKRNGVCVVRPDSGDPATMVYYVVSTLAEKFGYETNAKGYKVLPPYIRVIQGDGINEHSLYTILEHLTSRGYSADNVAFGMGAGLLQKCDRDTFQFAFKCSSTKVGDVVRDVYKDPANDQAKKSKRGRFAVDEEYNVWPEHALPAGKTNQLREVFRDGRLLVDETFQLMRDRT